MTMITQDRLIQRLTRLTRMRAALTILEPIALDTLQTVAHEESWLATLGGLRFQIGEDERSLSRERGDSHE